VLEQVLNEVLEARVSERLGMVVNNVSTRKVTAIMV
jgi:hypothetical protein